MSSGLPHDPRIGALDESSIAASESAAPAPSAPAGGDEAAGAQNSNLPAAATATPEADDERPRRLIGSQRADQPPAQSIPRAGAPQAWSSEDLATTMASALPPPAPKSGPQLRRGGALSADFEQELSDELGSLSIDALMAHGGLDPQRIPPDTRLTAKVVKVYRDDVFVALGGPNEGIVSLRQFKDPPPLGSDVEVIVVRFRTAEGLYEVKVPGQAQTVDDWGDLQPGSVIEVRVTGANTGGLECMVGSVRGFIPISQIAMERVENLGDYVGQKLVCEVSEANPKRKNLVLSRRVLLEREREAARQSILDSLQEGQILEGTVRSVREFGAFVDLGGVDGMVHISKLSWDRIDHPSQVLSEGQKIRVKIEKIDRQTGKISLTYRDLFEDPWDRVDEKYPPNAVVRGVVSRLAKFGAFVRLEPGIEGLVHISELAHFRVVNPAHIVKEGQEVEVKVLSVDRATQKISLSLKALQQAPEPRGGRPKSQAEEETPLEPTVPKRQGPLKGGLNRPSGGEGLGLQW